MDAEKRNRLKRHAKSWLIALILVVFAYIAVRIAIPFVVSSIEFREGVLDLSDKVTNAPPGLFKDKSVRYRFTVRRNDSGGYNIPVNAMLLGWPCSAEVRIKPKWRFLGTDFEGEANFRLNGSAFRLHAEFSGALHWSPLFGPKVEWNATFEMPKAALSGKDPFLGWLVSNLEGVSVFGDGGSKATDTLLEFDGEVELKGQASQTLDRPVPKWGVTGRASGMSVRISENGRQTVITNLRIPFGASGVGDVITILPMFIKADRLETGGITFLEPFASVRATEAAFLVTEAGTGFCGGKLRLYSLFLDTTRLNAGATIFIDNVDTGQVLGLLDEFDGEATGKLNGKLPLRLINGREIRLGTAYLQSVPGETGKIMVYDPDSVASNLAMAGVTQDAASNIAKALTNLDYTVLRFSLEPEGEGQMLLTVKLQGSATRGTQTVPVSFEASFHGDIEHLANTSLQAATRRNKKK